VASSDPTPALPTPAPAPLVDPTAVPTPVIDPLPAGPVVSGSIPTPATPVVPTQVAHSWRAVARTVFAVIVAFAFSWSGLAAALGLNATWQWVSVATLITGGITKILASPMVEGALQQYVPWLAAQPKQ
jgi:hypothetical protein